MCVCAFDACLLWIVGCGLQTVSLNNTAHTYTTHRSTHKTHIPQLSLQAFEEWAAAFGFSFDKLLTYRALVERTALYHVMLLDGSNKAALEGAARGIESGALSSLQVRWAYFFVLLARCWCSVSIVVSMMWCVGGMLATNWQQRLADKTHSQLPH